ncbi:MAG: endolytic transglycosylase MltG, partial [Alphaproteobacteria bacterium]
YYFVLDGSGGHAFAENLQQHNRNVAAWRKIERERSSN